MGGLLSPPQIHQKVIWMLSNLHKITSECWRRAPGTQKGFHILQKEVGQNIKDKMRDKRVMDGIGPREGVITEEKFPNSRKPSHQWVYGEFWNLRAQHNWEAKTKQNTEYMSKHNSQGRSSPNSGVCHQLAGAGQGGVGCMLRVRTGSQWPGGNMKELTWDSNPNCGIARESEGEKKKKTERERELSCEKL